MPGHTKVSNNASLGDMRIRNADQQWEESCQGLSWEAFTMTILEPII
jgi:hypothetical protein